jgi:hypothetical protein
MKKNKFVTECPICSHEYTSEDINGGRCTAPGCGTMITDSMSRAAETTRRQEMIRKYLAKIKESADEIKKLKAKNKKMAYAIAYMYDTLYFDSEAGEFDPDKEWGSAADFIEMVHDLIVPNIIPKPEMRTRLRPEFT